MLPVTAGGGGVAAAAAGGVSAAAACWAMAGADAVADAASASGRMYLRMLMLSLRVNGKLLPTVSISCAIEFLSAQSKSYCQAGGATPYISAWISGLCPPVVRVRC